MELSCGYRYLFISKSAAVCFLVGCQAWACVEQSLLVRQVLGYSAVKGGKAGFQRGNSRGWQVTGLSPEQLHILSQNTLK